MSGVEKAKLAVPTNNPMLPIGPEELVKLGAGYSHVDPAPTAILLKSMRERVTGIHGALGRTPAA